MPLISGQAAGLIAGIVIVVLYTAFYFVMKPLARKNNTDDIGFDHKKYRARFSEEFSDELKEEPKKENESCKKD